MTPADLSTCPLSENEAGESAGPVDAATLQQALVDLPSPKQSRTKTPNATRSFTANGQPAQQTLFDPPEANPPPKVQLPKGERPARRCRRCGRTLGPGESVSAEVDGESGPVCADGACGVEA